jgi:hypothetical protein
MVAPPTPPSRSWRVAILARREPRQPQNGSRTYLRDIVASWPRAEVVPEALTRLVQAYRELGYVEDVNETCTYFRRQWPEAPKLGDTCPVPKDSTTAPGEIAKGS